MSIDIEALHEKIEQESGFVEALTAEVGKVIVGDYMVHRSFCNFPLRGNFSGYRGLG